MRSAVRPPGSSAAWSSSSAPRRDRREGRPNRRSSTAARHADGGRRRTPGWWPGCDRTRRAPRRGARPRRPVGRIRTAPGRRTPRRCGRTARTSARRSRARRRARRPGRAPASGASSPGSWPYTLLNDEIAPAVVAGVERDETVQPHAAPLPRIVAEDLVGDRRRLLQLIGSHRRVAAGHGNADCLLRCRRQRLQPVGGILGGDRCRATTAIGSLGVDRDHRQVGPVESIAGHRRRVEQIATACCG